MHILTHQFLENKHPAFFQSLNKDHTIQTAKTDLDFKEALGELHWDICLAPYALLENNVTDPESGRGILLAVVPDYTSHIEACMRRPDIDDLIPEDLLDSVGQAKLEKYIQLRKNLFGIKIQIDTLVHDFRTPMTIALTTLELLLLKNMDVDKDTLSIRIRSIKAHIDRMKNMLANFVDCNRMEALSFQPVPCDVSEILNKIIESQSVRFNTEKRSFYYEGAPLSINIDREVLKRCIINMLEHAILMAETGSHLPFEVTTSGDTFTIRLQYSGGGVLTRFALNRIYLNRGEKIPDPKTGIKYNKGFGLSYNLGIAKKMGGSFTINMTEKSHTMELCLPIT